MENTFDGEVKYENDEIVSSNKGGRGYGLKNIQKSVDNYNGYMEINHGDGLLSVDVMLYVKTI
jgi:sensor histidine kinase YesM